MKCNLCSEDRKLVKAHIIPRSLYKPLLEEGQPLSVLSSSPGSHPRRSRIGLYDNEILCQKCESIFSPWDDYAQQVLLAHPKEEDYLTHNGQKIALKMDLDYMKIKLFFVSLLWRTSVSKFYFFKTIKVEPMEQQLKEMILKRDPGDAETFAVTLARFEDPLGTVVISPHRQRLDGVNYCRFFLGGYVAYIKTDKKPSPEFLQGLTLSPGNPLFVILRDLRQSKEFSLMQKTVRMWKAKR